MSRAEKSRKDALWTGVALAGIAFVASIFFPASLPWSTIALIGAIGGAVGGAYGVVTGGGKDTEPSQTSSAPSNARSAQLQPSQELAQTPEIESSKFRDMVANQRSGQRQAGL